MKYLNNQAMLERGLLYGKNSDELWEFCNTKRCINSIIGMYDLDGGIEFIGAIISLSINKHMNVIINTVKGTLQVTALVYEESDKIELDYETVEQLNEMVERYHNVQRG